MSSVGHLNSTDTSGRGSPPGPASQDGVDVVGRHAQVGQDVTEGGVPDCEAQVGDTARLEVIRPEVYQACTRSVMGQTKVRRISN